MKDTKDVVTRDLEKAVDLIEKHTDDSIVLGLVKGRGLFISISVKGDKKKDLATKKLCDMLLSLLVFCQPAKDGDNLKITQGKLDLAYLLCADIMKRLLALGATDFADIEEEIMNDGEDWVEAEDIRDAREDTEEICLDDDEDEDDEDEDESCVFKASLKDSKNIIDAVCKATGLPKKEVTEALVNSVVGLEEENKKTGDIKVKKVHLNKAQKAKLSKVLDEIESEED